MASGDKIGVLFVCTGNICRSPTAEAVFRHQVEKAGLADMFAIDSAGTHGYHVGDPPDHRSIAMAQQQGVDMTNLRARKVEPRDFEVFDYIYAMDSGHFRALKSFKGPADLSLFRSDGGDVPDPYYGALADFQVVYDMVFAGAGDILAQIIQKHSLKL